jgi:hypothetical protein
LILKASQKTAFFDIKTHLCTVQQWCDKVNLSMNPSKMVAIPFIKKRNLEGLKEPTLFNKTIQSTVRINGLMLGKGLTWKKQLDKVISKAYMVLRMCRSMFGKTLELKTRVVYWMYIVIARSIVT